MCTASPQKQPHVMQAAHAALVTRLLQQAAMAASSPVVGFACLCKANST